MSVYQWRSVTGFVESLPGRELDILRLEEFLATRKVVARGALQPVFADDSQDSSRYRLEVAVCGRRRRVAVLREDGSVGPGLNLAQLVEELAYVGMGVRANVLDTEAFGDPDLGAFDVTSELDPEDLLVVVQQEHLQDPDSSSTPVTKLLDQTNKTSEEVTELSEHSERPAKLRRNRQRYVHPDFTGPFLYLTDLPLAAVPGEAAMSGTALAALDLGAVRALVSQSSFNISWHKFDGQSFYIRLAGLEEGRPELIVRDAEAVRRSWDWNDELPDTEFTANVPAAAEFTAEYLGAHAMAHALADLVPGTNATEIHAALLCGPGAGPGLLLQALNLPTDVLAALVGLGKLEEIPGARVFDESGLARAWRESFRYHFASHGVWPGFWQAYRHIAVDNPWIRRTISVAELGLASTLWAWGRSGASIDKSGKKVCGHRILRSLTGVLVADVLFNTVLSHVVRYEMKAGAKDGVVSRQVWGK